MSVFDQRPAWFDHEICGKWLRMLDQYVFVWPVWLMMDVDVITDLNLYLHHPVHMVMIQLPVCDAMLID